MAPASASPADESPADESAKVMPGYQHVVFDGEFPTFPHSANSWALPAHATADPTTIKAVAAALGLAGDVTELPGDQGGGWLVGSSDWTGPSLRVVSSGALTFYYSGVDSTAISDECGVGISSEAPPALATAAAAVSDTIAISAIDGPAAIAPDAIEPGDPGTTPPDVPMLISPAPLDTCSPAEIAPPTNVPTADEAGSKASKILKAAGLDPSTYLTSVTGDQYQATVTLLPTIDGIVGGSELGFTVTFGSEGVVLWASGTLAPLPTDADAAPVELLEPQAALDRYNARSMFVGAIDDAPPTGDGAVPDDVTISSDVLGTVDSSPDAGLAVVNAIPNDPAMAPMMSVKATQVELRYMAVWNGDGVAFIVPAYRFINDDGAEWIMEAAAKAFQPDTPMVMTSSASDG